MIANYHTHTPRCHHAEGAEEAYIRCALQAGLQTLGFSDHTPYPFPGNYVSSFRMLPDELAGYSRTVRGLQKQYADTLNIHLGVEAEYYPKFFPELVKMLQDQDVSYMILGQHMLYNEIEGIGSIGPTDSVELLRQYCDQSIEALYTGIFTYFAHPDLTCFTGSQKDYRQQVRRLCRAARECDIALEINLLGLRYGRHYPQLPFWEVAAEEGCSVVLGVDAHQPEALWDTRAEQQALQMISSLGLDLLEEVPLRPIG